MGFLHPELLLLALPALVLAWRARVGERARGATLVLRGLAAVLLLAAAAGTHLRLSANGRDLVVVVDRSRSMPSESVAQGSATPAEWIRFAEDARRDGDRVGVVSFAESTWIDATPSATATFQGFERTPGGHASDLAGALESALALLAEDRPGGVLVLSDGEANGGDPLVTARRFVGRGARIDVQPLRRPPEPDVAVMGVDVPARVDAGEPFQFVARVHADEAANRTFRLERGEVLLRTGTRELHPGENVLVFRDVVDVAGVYAYRLRLEGGSDRRPENDKGLGAVEVTGPRRVLVVNHDGRPDTLSTALSAAGFPIEVSAPESARLDPLGLSAYSVVVLEDVPARRLGRMEALRDFVLERGGGLWMTGGRGSFGVGGYHLSAVAGALPVTMEMREEQRKQGLALVIALDVSGSMGAPVASGETKMQLANAGAIAAIDLLSGMDAVSVYAVDMRAQRIVDAPSVSDSASIANEVLRISAGGGGIHTLNALEAAAAQLDSAPHENRHILLFADASDADAQGGCADLVDRLVASGVTLSVVALGTAGDPHAEFLRDLAERGQGEVYFSTLAEDLPRLFAEDTLRVAKSAFVEERTSAEVLPDLLALGDLALDAFPSVDGFNRAWMRPGSSCGVLTNGDPRSPLFAFGHRGLGRGAAYMGQVGGTYGADFVAWPQASTFLTTVTRWCMGEEEPLDVFVDVERRGARAIVSLELDPDAELRADLAALDLRVGAPGSEWRTVLLERVSEERFEAAIDATLPGVTLGTVDLGDGRFARVPPVAVSWSPEFEPGRDPLGGERLLRRLAAETGGTVAPIADDLFRGERSAVRYRSVGWELTLAGLLLLLLEIAGRRLQLWGSGQPASEGFTRAEAKALRERQRRSRSIEREVAELEAPPQPTEAPAAKPTPRAGTADMADALERARREASRRMGG